MTPSWSWKPKDADSANLLYEPGNWGDLLKGAWVVEAAGWLLAQFTRLACQYVDPFAGAPAYPLTAGTRARLAAVGPGRLAEVAEDFIEKGIWPSAAALVAAVSAEKAEIRVFDNDPERRQSLAECPNFTVLDGEDGWEIATRRAPGERGLVLIDPYDFLKEWQTRLEGVLALAEKTSVLVYIYNRSARGREEFRQYRDFRNALDSQRGEKPKLLGRVAADSFLPAAHHEMLFLPGPACYEHDESDSLIEALAAVTVKLDRVIRAGGVVEP